MSIGSKQSSDIEGKSLIGGGLGVDAGETFTAFDPRTGQAVTPDFYTASADEVELAVELAEDARTGYAHLSNNERAALLNRIADNLESIKTDIVTRASLESGLPEARFEGELGRTCGQLRLFAGVALEGSWVDARIDRAIPDREPLPKPDVRSMLQPIGPVVVFCASNFPLAFSVAGGDSASALASGCPVIVVAHTAHPGTAELAGKAISKAVSEMGLDSGIFSLIFSKGYAAGQSLVGNPLVKAVGFTGSRTGGRALMDIAAARPEPIPVFAEMSSVNPVFVLPEALDANSDSIAEGLFVSFTLGFGQFCTKPGIVVLPKSESTTAFAKKLEVLTRDSPPSPLLTKGIRSAYEKGTGGRENISKGLGSKNTDDFTVPTTISTVSAAEFLNDSSLSAEVFGPSTLLVIAESKEDYLRIAKSTEGQLTATIHGTDGELADFGDLTEILTTKAGRLVFNSFPTGVEVCGAMVHGGPYPATSDARTTSVGKRAIERFARLVAYQGFPDETLPDALKDDNPLKLKRIEE